MRVEKEDIEFWLAVNDKGDRVLSFDGAASAIAELLDEYGGTAVRTVGMTVSMALPAAARTERLVVTDEDVDAGDIETAIDQVEEEAA